MFIETDLHKKIQIFCNTELYKNGIYNNNWPFTLFLSEVNYTLSIVRVLLIATPLTTREEKNRSQVEN